MNIDLYVWFTEQYGPLCVIFQKNEPENCVPSLGFIFWNKSDLYLTNVDCNTWIPE